MLPILNLMQYPMGTNGTVGEESVQGGSVLFVAQRCFFSGRYCIKRELAQLRQQPTSAKATILWLSYVIGRPYIFSFCNFYFFSSPNLSGRTLDVYHTSTHGVALVRI